MSYFPFTSATVVAAIAGEDIAPANIDPTAGSDITLGSGSQLVLPNNEVSIVTTDVDSGYRINGKNPEMARDNGAKVQIGAGGVSVLASDLNVTGGNVVLANRLSATPSTQAITAVTDTISPTSLNHRITADADYTLTSNPCIAAGLTNGQLLILQNDDGVDTITLPDGNGVELVGGVNLALAPKDSAIFVWNAGDAKWYQSADTGNV